MADNPYAPPSAAESPSASGSTAPAPGMAQCSITKKWFPEDELVTFQGQLVSAEGKQILLDRLQTGASAPNEFVRPGAWRRIGCIFFIDGILIGVLGLILDYACGITFSTSLADPTLILRRIIVSILGLAVAILYFGLLHGWKGQSLGKMVGNLRVINMDGTPISKPKAFGRALAYTFGNVLIVLALLVGLLTKNMAIIGWGSGLAALWGLTDCIMALADTHMQRSLHDRICGTRVIWLNA